MNLSKAIAVTFAMGLLTLTEAPILGPQSAHAASWSFEWVFYDREAQVFFTEELDCHQKSELVSDGSGWPYHVTNCICVDRFGGQHILQGGCQRNKERAARDRRIMEGNQENS